MKINIESGESILHRAYMSPMAYIVRMVICIPMVILLVGMTIMSVISARMFDEQHPDSAAMLDGTIWISVFMLLGFLAPLVIAFINYKTSMFVLTTQKVFSRTGVIRVLTTNMPLTQVERADMSVSLFGRLYGYGTVIVTGTGGSKTEFEKVSRPETLLDAINKNVLGKKENKGVNNE